MTIVTQERACLFGIVDGHEMQLNEAGAMIRRTWLALPERFQGIAIDEFVVMPNHIHGLIVIIEPEGAPLVGAWNAALPGDGAGDIDGRATTRVATTGEQEADGAGINKPVGAPLVGARYAAQSGVGAGDSGSRATTRVAPTQYQNLAETDGKSGIGARGEDRRYTLSDVVGAFKSLTTVEYVRGVKAQHWPRFPGKLWQRNYYEHVVRREDSLDKIRQYIRDNPARWAFDGENPARVPGVAKGR